MSQGANQEGDEGGDRSGDKGARCAIDVTTEEVMDWDVPFSAEL